MYIILYIYTYSVYIYIPINYIVVYIYIMLCSERDVNHPWRATPPVSLAYLIPSSSDS